MPRRRKATRLALGDEVETESEDMDADELLEQLSSSQARSTNQYGEMQGMQPYMY